MKRICDGFLSLISLGRRTGDRVLEEGEKQHFDANSHRILHLSSSLRFLITPFSHALTDGQMDPQTDR